MVSQFLVILFELVEIFRKIQHHFILLSMLALSYKIAFIVLALFSLNVQLVVLLVFSTGTARSLGLRGVKIMIIMMASFFSS